MKSSRADDTAGRAGGVDELDDSSGAWSKKLVMIRPDDKSNHSLLRPRGRITPQQQRNWRRCLFWQLLCRYTVLLLDTLRRCYAPNIPPGYQTAPRPPVSPARTILHRHNTQYYRLHPSLQRRRHPNSIHLPRPHSPPRIRHYPPAKLLLTCLPAILPLQVRLDLDALGTSDSNVHAKALTAVVRDVKDGSAAVAGLRAGEDDLRAGVGAGRAGGVGVALYCAQAEGGMVRGVGGIGQSCRCRVDRLDGLCPGGGGSGRGVGVWWRGEGGEWVYECVGWKGCSNGDLWDLTAWHLGDEGELEEVSLIVSRYSESSSFAI